MVNINIMSKVETYNYIRDFLKCIYKRNTFINISKKIWLIKDFYYYQVIVIANTKKITYLK